MTWSQFFQSMRNGVGNRAAAVTRRAKSQQPANRAASTQASQTAVTTEAVPKKPPMEFWDYYIIDVSLL